MSAGSRRLDYAEARTRAITCYRALRPLCARVQVAGSLRRELPSVGDIEFVVEPRRVPDLFGTGAPDLAPIAALARSWGTLIRDGDRQKTILCPDRVTLELWIVHAPASWGSILAIRTGPASLAREAVTRMPARGYRHVDGYVLDATRGRVPTETEEQFFAAAGLPCLPPPTRSDWVRHLPSGAVDGTPR